MNPSLIINSLTYVCVSGEKNFFQIWLFVIKQNSSLEWFETLKTFIPANILTSDQHYFNVVD